MSTYRVEVHIKLFNDDTETLVTYDDYLHYFGSPRADGGHEHYIAIDNAVFEAIEELDEAI